MFSLFAQGGKQMAVELIPAIFQRVRIHMSQNLSELCAMVYLSDMFRKYKKLKEPRVTKKGILVTKKLYLPFWENPWEPFLELGSIQVIGNTFGFGGESQDPGRCFREARRRSAPYPGLVLKSNR
jgi:hypothetical protein